MDNDQHHEPTPWEETGGVIRPAAWAGRSTPANAGSSAARRADDAEFISILTPCLNLVAPVGMDVDTQDAWLESATLVLADVPVDLLRRGAAAAMKTADHHSKIVPAIMAEVERLRATERHVERVWEGASNHPGALPAPGGERPTAGELDEICKRYGVGRYSTNRPAQEARRDQPASADKERHCRTPTRADYVRMGVSAEVLDRMGINDPAEAA